MHVALFSAKEENIDAAYCVQMPRRNCDKHPVKELVFNMIKHSLTLYV
jgi:hypothetical protein